MASRFGKYLVNVLGGTLGNLAGGASFNAAERVQREVFLLDEVGAATAAGTTLCIGRFRKGDIPLQVRLVGSVSLAAVSFSVGTLAAPTKYGAATAGGAANVPLEWSIIDAAMVTAEEDIYLTTSVAALPTTAGAKAQAIIRYAHR